MIVVYDTDLGCLDLNPIGQLYHMVSVPQFSRVGNGDNYTCSPRAEH